MVKQTVWCLDVLQATSLSIHCILYKNRSLRNLEEIEKKLGTS